MAAPSPVEPRPARSRFRRVRFGLAGLLILFLIGRGFGLVGRAERGPAPFDPLAAAREPAAKPDAQPPVAVGSARGDGSEAAPAAAAPLAESARANVATVPPADQASPANSASSANAVTEQPAAATPTFDADRFASRLSLLQATIDDGRLGLAIATLAELRELPLDGAQQAALAMPAEQLGAAMATCCSRLVAQLARGDVFAARHALDLLASDAEAPLLPSLHQALALAGVDVALLSPQRRDDGAVPIARPLPRGRLVRVRRGGELLSGRVADSRSDEATVRLEQGGRVVFPTVPVVAIEPVEATVDEAAEMGFAALQAGDVRLARLWLASARLRGQGPSPRLDQLAALLP